MQFVFPISDEESMDESGIIDTAQWEAEWNETCDRRDAELESGKVVPISAAEAFDRLSRRANVSHDD